jgi:hypothetical protein
MNWWKRNDPMEPVLNDISTLIAQLHHLTARVRSLEGALGLHYQETQTLPAGHVRVNASILRGKHGRD